MRVLNSWSLQSNSFYPASNFPALYLGKSQCFPLKGGKVAFAPACSGCFRLSETSNFLSHRLVFSYTSATLIIFFLYAIRYEPSHGIRMRQLSRVPPILSGPRKAESVQLSVLIQYLACCARVGMCKLTFQDRK